MLGAAERRSAGAAAPVHIRDTPAASRAVANLVLWCTVAVILALIGTDLVQSHFEHVGEVAWTARFGPGTLLFAAQAVVAFEGIGIVLPVREAMSEPEAFPRMIVACMALGTVAFLVFGICSYVAFGEACCRHLPRRPLPLPRPRSPASPASPQLALCLSSRSHTCPPSPRSVTAPSRLLLLPRRSAIPLTAPSEAYPRRPQPSSPST